MQNLPLARPRRKAFGTQVGATTPAAFVDFDMSTKSGKVVAHIGGASRELRGFTGPVQDCAGIRLILCPGSCQTGRDPAGARHCGPPLGFDDACSPVSRPPFGHSSLRKQTSQFRLVSNDRIN